MLFKKHHVQIKLVKDSQPVADVIPTVTAEDLDRVSTKIINEVETATSNTIKKVVVGSIIVTAAAVVLSTISQIVVNECDKPKEDD